MPDEYDLPLVPGNAMSSVCNWTDLQPHLIADIHSALIAPAVGAAWARILFTARLL